MKNSIILSIFIGMFLIGCGDSGNSPDPKPTAVAPTAGVNTPPPGTVTASPTTPTPTPSATPANSSGAMTGSYLP